MPRFIFQPVLNDLAKVKRSMPAFVNGLAPKVPQDRAKDNAISLANGLFVNVEHLYLVMNLDRCVPEQLTSKDVALVPDESRAEAIAIARDIFESCAKFEKDYEEMKSSLAGDGKIADAMVVLVDSIRDRAMDIRDLFYTGPIKRNPVAIEDNGFSVSDIKVGDVYLCYDLKNSEPCLGICSAIIKTGRGIIATDSLENLPNPDDLVFLDPTRYAIDGFEAEVSSLIKYTEYVYCIEKKLENVDFVRDDSVSDAESAMLSLIKSLMDIDRVRLDAEKSER